MILFLGQWKKAALLTLNFLLLMPAIFALALASRFVAV